MATQLDPTEFLIPSTKVGALSYLSLMSSMGYQHWHRGQVKAEKVIGFVKKMHELYPELSLKETARMRAKARGIANIKLVIFPDKQVPGEFLWWLLATSGKGLIFERERMKNSLEYPLLWLNQYQLHKITSVYKPTQQGARQQRQTWSWSWQGSYGAELKATVKSYADSTDAKAALGQLFDRLLKMPMFAGIRDDLQDLDKYAAQTWAKKHKAPYAWHTQRLPYVSRVPVFDGLTLGPLLVEMQARKIQDQERARVLACSLLDGEDAPVRYTQSLVSKPRSAKNALDQEKQSTDGDLFPEPASGADQPD